MIGRTLPTESEADNSFRAETAQKQRPEQRPRSKAEVVGARVRVCARAEKPKAR